MTYPAVRHYQIGGGTAERLTVSDYWFVNPDGTLHRRKSITAFTLPKRFATGRGDDARRYMDWAAGLGYNEFRVFTRVDWVGPPGSGVETGWEYDEAACLHVLEEAARRGCHVELVAHTGRMAEGFNAMARHLIAVDVLAETHENGLLEIYNEPQQNGGNDLVADLIASTSPQTPGWSSGVYDQTPYTSIIQTGVTPDGKPIYAATADARVGPSMSYHSPRKDEWPRCFKDAFEYSTGQGPNVPFTPGYHGPVMLDEPPQVERTAVPDEWEAYGAGAAMFAAGVTMHGNPSFQRCEIPTDPAVLACCAALIRGMDAVPLQRYFGYEHPDDQGSLRRYRRFGADGKRYEISVRPFAFAAV